MIRPVLFVLAERIMDMIYLPEGSTIFMFFGSYLCILTLGAMIILVQYKFFFNRLRKKSRAYVRKLEETEAAEG